MRKPIRTKVRREGAARPIQYSLGPVRAWLLGTTAALAMAGCDAGIADPPDGPAQSGIEQTLIASATAIATPAHQLESNPTKLESAIATRPVIVFLGTSLTAGYGLEEAQAFPALIQTNLDKANLNYRVVNAGVSGDTSAGGLRRLNWLLRLPIAVLVVELGANDMLRGQDVQALRSNLEMILDRTSKAHPDVRFLIAGMRAAPNLGEDYVSAFDATYLQLAKQYSTAFVPFLLEDVAAKRNLNQADGIHPTAEGHELIAKRVWLELESILR